MKQPLHAEKELIPAFQAYGMGLLPFFPLANGLLTGKYRLNVPMPEGARLTTTQRFANRYLTAVNWARTEKLVDLAASQGKTMVELAFSWLAMQPVVSSVIASRH